MSEYEATLKIMLVSCTVGGQKNGHSSGRNFFFSPSKKTIKVGFFVFF